MFISKLIYFVIFVTNLLYGSCKISDKRLCVNEKCSVPISKAVTLIRYASPEEGVLSFAPNQNVIIYSKEAGSRLDLWGAEINGRRGYIPKQMVRENKVFKTPTITVDTELKQALQVPKVTKTIVEPEVKPDKTQEPFEIIDGTKVYFTTEPTVELSDSQDSNTLEEPDISIEEEDIDEESNTSNEEVVRIPENSEKEQQNVPTLNLFSLNINESVSDLNLDKDSKGGIESSNTEKIYTKQISNEKESAEPTEVKKDIEPTETGPENVAGSVLESKESAQEEIPQEKVIQETTAELKSGKNNETDQGSSSEVVEKPNSGIVVDQNISDNLNETNDTIVEPTDKNLEENDNVDVNKIDLSEDILNRNLAQDDSSQLKFPQSTDEINKIISNIENQIIEKTNEKSRGIEYSTENIEPTGGMASTFTPLFYNPANFAASPPSASNDNLSDDKIEDNLTGNIPIDGKKTDILSEQEETQSDPILSMISSEKATEPKDSVLSAYNVDSASNEDLNSMGNNNDFEFSDIENVTQEFYANPDKVYVETPEATTIPESKETESVSSTVSSITKDEYLSDVFADTTTTEKQLLDENMDNSVVTNEGEPSTGIFSMFTNIFDWSNSEIENTDSAVEKVNDNLKCDLNNDVFGSIFNLNSSLMVYLTTTIVLFITFLIFFASINKSRVESPLVAKINQLEKDLLIMMKEKESLVESGPIIEQQVNFTDTEEFLEINQKLLILSKEKESLESKLNSLQEVIVKKDGQIENLEKELETSTEVGMELNRIISEMLDPTADGSEKLKENVELLQRQLQEQKDIIKNMNARLNVKEVENAELLAEIEENRNISLNLQQKIHALMEKITSIEREKEAQQITLQDEIRLYQTNYNELIAKDEILNREILALREKLTETEREIDLKVKECNNLKESFKDLKFMKNDNTKLKTMLDTISMKAEYEQMKADIEKYIRELKQNETEKTATEKKYQLVAQELEELRKRYQQTDKEKLETDMKLEVLNNYFKKRETELQEEVLKYKAIWDAKEGEATSTTERFKLLQEEIVNYKAQNEALKQEILSQEIALKSQITMLEKKVHDNWVNARQAERKLEDARQEAAQLRNRLTFRQRNEEMVPNGLDPNDSNLTTHSSVYSPASPPIFYENGRDQITKSPLPGLPFLPPPPGAPFVPPPVPNHLPGMPLPPPFMPPLPTGFPGDHRPPPLGRMSSPPIKSRYSPESAFSPYERGTPSPSVYDSEYGGGPPYRRDYSPYNSEEDRRGYRSPSPISRTKTRPSKNSRTSPGVNRSNESLEKINSKKPNMV